MQQLNLIKPIYSDIGILESCNLKCDMCKMYEIPFLKKEEIIPLERWNFFFKDMREISGPDFIFNIPGGEPLLHPHVYDIIELASSYGLKPLLSTNASLITKNVAEKLIKKGLFAVTISLDSSISKTHDKIRGVEGTFDKVQRAIRYLQFFSKIYRNEDFNIGVQGVIQKSNLDNIVDLVLYTERHTHIQRINLNLLMKPNNSKDDENWYKNEFKDLWPDNIEDVESMFDKLIKLKKKNIISKLINSITQLESYKVYFKNPKSTPKLVNCNYDKSICTNSSGDIHMCYFYDKIGNLKEDRLIDVWNSDKANNIRKKINKCTITHCWFRLNCLYSD